MPRHWNSSGEKLFNKILAITFALLVGVMAALFVRVHDLAERVHSRTVFTQALQIFDTAGRPRITLRADHPDGHALLALSDGEGRARFEALVLGDGTVELRVNDMAGAPRWLLNINANDEAILVEERLERREPVLPEFITLP